MSYWMYDDFPDEQFTYKKDRIRMKSKKRISTDEIKKKLSKLSNDELCEKYFENIDDKGILNRVVPGSKFPAYDVAIKCYDNQWMSPKQRSALENVFSSYCHDYKKGEL